MSLSGYCKVISSNCKPPNRLKHHTGIISHPGKIMELKDTISSEKLPTTRRSVRKRIIIFSIISLLNAALLALLWVQLLTPAQNPNQGSSDNTFADPLQGHPAPNFTLAALGPNQTGSISLSN